MNAKHKLWLSPLIAVVFGAVAISGVFMLFHLRIPFMKPLHEWGGVAFVIVAVIHLIINWRPFVAYFRNKTAVLGAFAGVLVLLLTIIIAPADDKEGFDQHRQGNVLSHSSSRH